jgi:hypothetical protein
LSKLYNLSELEISNCSRLRTINLYNIDTTVNESKNILSRALAEVKIDDDTDYVQYHITDAKWSIGDEKEMNASNIFILDKMLDDKYAKPALDEEKKRLPYSAAFMGEITISNEAYSGNDPLTLYNKYISDNTFANVDMSFEADSAKLYNLIIHDGDGKIFWSKKTVPGTSLDSTFLDSGPNGAFDVTKLYKTSTDEFNYEFLRTWQVKDSAGNYKTTLSGDIPTGIIIDEDLHIYPDFSESKRSYEIMVKLKNPITKQTIDLLSGTFEYGTNLETILTHNGDKILPYVEDPKNSLNLLEGYNLRGYSLSADGDVLISEKSYAVHRADTLWAVFEHTRAINTIVHPEWFTFKGETFEEISINSNDNGYYQDPDSKYHVSGVILKPISKNLSGKITIPAYWKYNGIDYPVVGISGFAENKNITHVFMESNKIN